MPSATLFVIWMASLWLCSGDTRVALDEFQGVWKTTSANYDDRFFEIANTTITFGTGDGKQDIYYIRAATKRAEDKDTVYTITYENPEGTEFRLSFYYQQSRGGVIQLKNQRDIEWARINSMPGKELSEANES
jgi:hypothetical protein